MLAGTETKVCSVCGFPLGYSNTETKAEEAALLVELGCREVDMVMNIAGMLEGEVLVRRRRHQGGRRRDYGHLV